MKKNGYIIFVLGLLLLSFCRRDHQYPVIVTHEVTDIDSTGAIFNGEIRIFGSKEILDYGFLWTEKTLPRIDNSYRSSLNDLANEKQFYEKVSDHIENRSYNVRAYVLTYDGVFYGNIVSFKSKGSLKEPWKQLNDFPGQYRRSILCFEINGKAYFGGGGYTDFWEFDSENRTWTPKSNIPPISRFFHSYFSTETKAYYFDDDYFWQYDPISNSWNYMGNSPFYYSHSIAFSIANKAYVGFDPQNFYEYDELTNSWIEKANLPVFEARGTGFSIGSKGYIVSGEYNDLGLWEYDPVLDAWNKKLDLTGTVSEISGGRVNLICTTSFTINGKGYFSMVNSTKEEQINFYEYDPIANTCRSIPGLPKKRFFNNGISINNKGYVINGFDEDFNEYTDFWEFDPSKLKPNK